MPGTNDNLNYFGIFLFGCFALPLYSLSAAHANDFAHGNNYILISAGMMFFWSIGAISGPLVASALMQVYGPGVLFIFTSIVHALLVVVTIWRMTVRATVPRDKRSSFVGLVANLSRHDETDPEERLTERLPEWPFKGLIANLAILCSLR